jgi:AraC-like DNA-binding protein
MASKPQTYSTSFPTPPLYPPAETNQQHAIIELQKNWHRLHDVDRAQAIKALIDSGLSGRSIAKSLHCSESLIRRLLRTLQASPADIELGRRGEISTSELARRAKANQSRLETRQREVEERKRASEAAKLSRDILRWLCADSARQVNAEQIVYWARQHHMLAEQTGGLPTTKAPAGMKLDQIIRLCRPKRSSDELDVSFSASWLALWVFHASANWAVRWTAMDQALSQVSSRFWIRDL